MYDYNVDKVPVRFNPNLCKLIHYKLELHLLNSFYPHHQALAILKNRALLFHFHLEQLELNLKQLLSYFQNLVEVKDKVFFVLLVIFTIQFPIFINKFLNESVDFLFHILFHIYNTRESSASLKNSF